MTLICYLSLTLPVIRHRCYCISRWARPSPRAPQPAREAEAVTTTSLTGRSPRPWGLLDLRTTSMPSTTVPNTTWRPFNHGVAVVVMKNCDPLVLGPALAMESTPGPTCASLSRGNASSGNFLP